MNKDYIISNYRSGDEEGLVGLLDEVFRGGPKFDVIGPPVDHWR